MADNKRNILDDTLSFGLGILFESKDKVEEVVDRMVQRGEVEKEKREDVVNEYVEKGKIEKEKFEEAVDERIKEFITNNVNEDILRRIVNEELDKRENK